MSDDPVLDAVVGFMSCIPGPNDPRALALDLLRLLGTKGLAVVPVELVTMPDQVEVHYSLGFQAPAGPDPFGVVR